MNTQKLDFYSQNNEDFRLSVMRITENAEYYLSKIDLTDIDKEEYVRITHPLKKNQWAASRFLLKRLSNETKTLWLEKNKTGKPSFSNLDASFSISHSDNYVSVIYSIGNEVAIDIEFYDDKILRIEEKFLHPSEYKFKGDRKTLCTIWSIKESVYKYFDSLDLVSFKKSIIVKAIHANTATIEVIFENKVEALDVFFVQFEEIVLSFIV